ncbi:hypothetical protein U1Q18_002999 [Sarracenia purpurea var. burkii]
MFSHRKLKLSDLEDEVGFMDIDVMLLRGLKCVVIGSMFLVQSTEDVIDIPFKFSTGHIDKTAMMVNWEPWNLNNVRVVGAPLKVIKCFNLPPFCDEGFNKILNLNN